MPLTDIECRNAKPNEKVKKISDGHGLQLWIMPNGSKLWRQDYRLKAVSDLALDKLILQEAAKGNF